MPLQNYAHFVMRTLRENNKIKIKLNFNRESFRISLSFAKGKSKVFFNQSNLNPRFI